MLQDIKIGSFYSQTSYMTAFYVGCVFFILLLCSKKRREVYGFPLWKAAIMSVISVVFGCLTTKIFFALEKRALDFSGFSWFGAVFFMPLAILLIFWLCRYVLKISTYNYINNLAAPLALMCGFMKIGCTLYGCCGGWPCSWGIYSAVANNTLFPIQPIESIANFAICAYLVWYERRPGKYRYTYSVYLIIYGVVRFICEFFRDVKKIGGLLSEGMICSLVALIAGIVWYLIRKNMDNKADYASEHRPAGASGWRQK